MTLNAVHRAWMQHPRCKVMDVPSNNVVGIEFSLWPKQMSFCNRQNWKIFQKIIPFAVQQRNDEKNDKAFLLWCVVWRNDNDARPSYAAGSTIGSQSNNSVVRNSWNLIGTKWDVVRLMCGWSPVCGVLYRLPLMAGESKDEYLIRIISISEWPQIEYQLPHSVILSWWSGARSLNNFPYIFFVFCFFFGFPIVSIFLRSFVFFILKMGNKEWIWGRRKEKKFDRKKTTPTR